jgi:hypothetical protein
VVVEAEVLIYLLLQLEELEVQLLVPVVFLIFQVVQEELDLVLVAAAEVGRLHGLLQILLH